MKALSLIQPWAYAILWLGKDVENRDWRSPPPADLVGQRFAIHASKKADADAAFELESDGFHLPHEVPLGAICGSVRLRGWVRDDGRGVDPKVLRHSSSLTRAEAEQLVRSRWRTGPLLLAVDQRLAYAEPIPCKGALGFWTPTPEDLVRMQQREEAARALGFDPKTPHAEPDQDDALGLGSRRDPTNPLCRCSELMRCDACLERERVQKKGAADRSRARELFEAAGQPVPAWAREP